MGAWIETKELTQNSLYQTVAPYVGAWIETAALQHCIPSDLVAPYVGAWIETFSEFNNYMNERSHPTWVRGLKHVAQER